MPSTSQLLIFAAVFAFVLFPIRLKSTGERLFFFGLVVATAINGYFYFQLKSEVGIRRFNEWHLLVAVYVPTLLACPLIAIMVLIRALLRGSTPARDWGVSEARSLLANDKNVVRRGMARVLIATTSTASPLMGWALGSMLFSQFLFHNR